MQVNSINNTNTDFGSFYNLPRKKTYSAMQAYYELINDKGTALEYKMLDKTAKARLHFFKHKKAENDLLDIAEAKVSGSRLQYALEFGKLRMKSFGEKLASAFYYYL